MKIIFHLIVTACALLLVAQFIPGIAVANLYTALIAALILGILNVLVKPILVLITLPINIITLGLFTFVINAALFAFAASFVAGFTVSGFVPALLGSLIVSVVSALFSKI